MQGCVVWREGRVPKQKGGNSYKQVTLYRGTVKYLGVWSGMLNNADISKYLCYAGQIDF